MTTTLPHPQQTSRNHPLPKTLFIFDFDDTLVLSNGARVQVHTTHPCGGVTTRRVHWDTYLSNPGKWERPNTKVDFKEFFPRDQVAIRWTMRMLRHVVTTGHGVPVVLTARVDPTPVQDFLRVLGLDTQVGVVALGTGPDPGPLKTKWILDKVREEGFTEVHIYEDRKRTLDLMKKVLRPVLSHLYGCHLHTHLVTKTHHKALGLVRVRTSAK